MAREGVGDPWPELNRFRRLRAGNAADVKLAIDRLRIDHTDALEAGLFRSAAPLAHVAWMIGREADAEGNCHPKVSSALDGLKSAVGSLKKESECFEKLSLNGETSMISIFIRSS